MPVVHAFCPGNWYSIHIRRPIPKGPPGFHLELRIGVSISRLYTAIEHTDSTLMYKVVGFKRTAILPKLKEIPKIFRGLDNLRPGKLTRVKYVIPSKLLEHLGGGELGCWFMTLSTSTGPVFYVDEFMFRTVVSPHKEGVFLEN